jgi:transposase-like protein
MTHAQHIMPDQRAQLVQTMIQQTGTYGAVTALSRTHQVSRQTLYSWKAQGLATLTQAFVPPPPPSVRPNRDRAILTLWMEGHNSTRDMGQYEHCCNQTQGSTKYTVQIGQALRHLWCRSVKIQA